MKHFLFCLMGLLCFFSAAAQDKLVFIVGDDVCTPVTVRCQGSSYKVYGYLEVNRTSSYITVSATDCNGNKLKYSFGSRSGTSNGRSYSIDTYTFHTVATYGGGNSSGSYGGSDYIGNSDSYDSAARAGAALSQILFGLGGGADGEAYPSLQFQVGASYAYGEFARFRYSGHGFNAYASIGKDWIFDSEFRNKILWNVGIGSYFAFGGNGDPSMDVGLGLSIGQNSRWEKLSLMIDADYTYWIGRWRRVGIFAGGSLGWGSLTEVFNTDDYSSTGGFAWNLEVGITFRLANF